MAPPLIGTPVLIGHRLWGTTNAGTVVGLPRGELLIQLAAATRHTPYVRKLCDEGVTWVRGWEGEVPDAFRVLVALQKPATEQPTTSADLQWLMR